MVFVTYRAQSLETLLALVIFDHLCYYDYRYLIVPDFELIDTYQVMVIRDTCL